MKKPTEEQRLASYEIVGKFTTAEVASIMKDLERLLDEVPESSRAFTESLIHGKYGYHANKGRLSVKQLFYASLKLRSALLGVDEKKSPPPDIHHLPQSLLYVPTDFEEVAAVHLGITEVKKRVKNPVLHLDSLGFFAGMSISEAGNAYKKMKDLMTSMTVGMVDHQVLGLPTTVTTVKTKKNQPGAKPYKLGFNQKLQLK